MTIAPPEQYLVVWLIPGKGKHSWNWHSYLWDLGGGAIIGHEHANSGEIIQYTFQYIIVSAVWSCIKKYVSCNPLISAAIKSKSHCQTFIRRTNFSRNLTSGLSWFFYYGLNFRLWKLNGFYYCNKIWHAWQSECFLHLYFWSKSFNWALATWNFVTSCV